MDLTTYGGLQAAIAQWIDHDGLTRIIPSFIALAEAQIARDVRNSNMVTSASLTISDRFTDLPTDHLATIRLDCNGKRLVARSTDDMIQMRDNDSAGGVPCYFTQVGRQIEVFPSPDASYTATLQYHARIPALDGENDTNWLLTEAPDAYLYGALIHAAPYLAEDTRTSTWAELYSAAVKNLNKSDRMGQWPSAISIPARNA